MNKKINIFSFFSGAGFFDLGFENSGFTIVFVNEIYNPFLESYCYANTRKSKRAFTGFS
jgi:DNA (cytosine-5)-methyltransferase 1